MSNVSDILFQVRIDVINDILNKRWDPLGVHKTLGTLDEYKSYAKTIAMLVMIPDVNDNIIAGYLRRVEIDMLDSIEGNPSDSNQKQLNDIARKIMSEAAELVFL